MLAQSTAIVTSALSCTVSEILQLLCSDQPLFPYPTSIPPEFYGCSPWTRLIMLLFTTKSKIPSLTMHVFSK